MQRSLVQSCASLVALTLLAGCGGGGGGAAGGTDAGSSAVAAPPVPTTTAGVDAPPASAVLAPPVADPPAAAPPAVPRTEIGVNLQAGGGSPQANAAIAATLARYGLRQVRLDYPFDADATVLRDQVGRIVQGGGRVQLVLQNRYQWDFRCRQDLEVVEQDSYDQAHAMVAAMKDLVRDYEILNEMQLRQDLADEVEPDSQGSSTAAYEDSPCAHTLAAVARGIARAVHDHGQRVILGAVGRDWSFLHFMRAQGVDWDVTGYHIYPRADSPSLLSDPWYGTGGPLVQLAAFGKPVTVNEFNCGEIYLRNYDNLPGSRLTEACLASIARHLPELLEQTLVRLESVLAFQLLDQPARRRPENRFGLMYALDDPKPALYLFGALAGASLTADEQLEITSRGLLTPSQRAGTP